MKDLKASSENLRIRATEGRALQQIHALVVMALDADESTKAKRMRDVQWVVDTLLSGTRSPFAGWWSSGLKDRGR